MTSRIVDTEQARDMLHRYIDRQKMPFTVTVEVGKIRSWKQNRLQRQWMNEIAEQLGDVTAEEARGYCKATFGVPIISESNGAFRVKWSRITEGMSAEQKIDLMMEPIDVPITRGMNTKQKKEYLDRISRHFSKQGVVLTDPETMGLPPFMRDAA